MRIIEEIKKNRKDEDKLGYLYLAVVAAIAIGILLLL